MRSIKLIDIECSYIIERLCQDVESINNTFGLSYDMTALPIYDDIMADSNRADLFCCKLEIIYLELTLFNLHSNPNGCNGVANSRSPYHSQQVVSIISNLLVQSPLLVAVMESPILIDRTIANRWSPSYT